MTDTPFQDDIYQYAERAQNALLGMIRDVMREAAENGLAGGHHFYLTFSTRAPGVEMSDKLRTAHSEEMTIVLQNQFEDLVITDEAFSVRLFFNQQPEDLVVPWEALSKFYDPSVAFGLMFEVAQGDGDMPTGEEIEAMLAPHQGDNEGENLTGEAGETGRKTAPVTGEVVSLDSFRDK